MKEKTLKEIFLKIVEQYELTPDAAAQLLQRILTILAKEKGPPLQSDRKCEMIMRHEEREELP